jgi:hypothetical protein
VFALGGAAVWTNALLGKDDNSALAVAVTHAGPGVPVSVLLPSRVASGRRSVTSLLGPQVKLALLQLLIAFVVVALWRGRRLGRPVNESTPVQLAASDLVVATGDLMARSRNANAAAAVLRRRLRRWLAARVGVGATAPVDVVAGAIAARTGAPVERVAALLNDAPVGDAAHLVTLAQALEDLRKDVTRAP